MEQTSEPRLLRLVFFNLSRAASSVAAFKQFEVHRIGSAKVPGSSRPESAVRHLFEELEVKGSLRIEDAYVEQTQERGILFHSGAEVTGGELFVLLETGGGGGVRGAQAVLQFA